MEAEALKKARRKVVGSKQTYRAVENGEARKVYIAEDAESKVVDPIIQRCKENSIDWYYISSMQELGQKCGIKVGAASAAVIEE